MEFDHKQVPADLLYKLEEAKREEADSMYADASGPTYPASGQSPVGEVAAEIFAHLADDGDFKQPAAEDTMKDLKDKKQSSKDDLDDRAKPRDGMRGDFMADTEGPVAAPDVGKPEKVTAAWDRDIGGGGGGSGGGAGGDGAAGPGDDYFEVDAWRRKRRSGEIDEGEGEVEEETPEGPESEENKG